MMNIEASQVRASDLVFFGDTPFKVKSSRPVMGGDVIEIVFWDTNMHQPYWYDCDELMRVSR